MTVARKYHMQPLPLVTLPLLMQVTQGSRRCQASPAAPGTGRCSTVGLGTHKLMQSCFIWPGEGQIDIRMAGGSLGFERGV